MIVEWRSEFGGSCSRFYDTPLPGLLSDVVAVALRGRTPEQFAAMIGLQATWSIANREAMSGVTALAI